MQREEMIKQEIYNIYVENWHVYPYRLFPLKTV